MATAPITPTNLRAWKKNEADVGLDWTNVKDATTYEAQFTIDKGVTVATWKDGTIVGDGRYIRHWNCPTPLTSLLYRIRAIGPGGTSAWTSWVEVKNGDGTPLVPVPVVVTPPAKATRKHRRGGITDGTAVAVYAPFYAKELYLSTVRIWIDFDANGDLDEAKLVKVNECFKYGITPRICFTPDEGMKTVPIPSKAIAKIIRVLDRRVQINLVNEPNWDAYWPKQDWRGAFKWASEVAGILSKAGFTCGCPCFTGFEDSWETYWEEIIWNGWHTNFRVLVYHNYGDRNAKAGNANWYTRFHKTNQTVRRIADRLSKLLGVTIATDCDEWGPGKGCPDEIWKPLMLKAYDSFESCGITDSAYFIVSRSGTVAKPKDPHDFYNWAIDFKTNTRRQLVIDGFAAVA